MSNSTNLNLPYLLSNQAQKHVTHNEALKMLDVLVQLSVVDNALSAPPQTPSEGDSYTIASSPTGDWAGKEYQVTIWHDGAWSFYPPNKGWITWVENNNSLQAYNGSQWVDISGVLSASTAPIFGINAAADTTNRLSINSGAILFNKEIDDVQVKLNKQASTDNASFLFQTNFSGRAEIGTSGDDDFHFKVSPDGATWKEGILIDATTGEVTFPNTILNAASSVDPIDDLVTRIFARLSPTQWGFCHVGSEAYTDLAKTTKAVAADDVIAVIEDKSPNNIDLVAGGTDAANKIKLRLDPLTVGVDAAHLTTHFLKVTVPTGGFKGKLIVAYRSGCIVFDVEAPAGDWEIWSGHSFHVDSGFIGLFAAENISNFETEEVARAFQQLGAGSKPVISAGSMTTTNTDDVYKTADFKFFDFSKTTTFYQALNTSDIEKVKINSCIVSSVTTLNRAFYDCIHLTNIDLNGWDTSKVNTINRMFTGCTALTRINIMDWDVSSVSDMGYFIHGCTALTRIDLNSWNTSSVTTIKHMFFDCCRLRTIDLSEWDLSLLTDATNAFKKCDVLKTIIVGNAFDNTLCTNFSGTFLTTALDQQSVDDILVSIEKAGTSNGTLNINGGTSSAPSSVGATAKTVLIGRGWTVTTN